MVAPLAVDLRALRVLVGPDIKIVPGRAVMARVVQAQGGGRGSLSIAGYLLDAELPASVRTGDDLRLVVRDVTAQRVLLAITEPHEEQAAPAQQATPQAATQQAPAPPPHSQSPDAAMPPPLAVPLPGGGSIQVTERDGGGAGGRRSPESGNVLLRYDAPQLGAVDLRFQMDAGSLRLGVSVAPGQPLDLAQASVESLRQAVAAAMPGRAVSVTVSPRREPLDVYA